MIRRSIIVVTVLSLVAAGVLAGELGPKELRGRTAKVRADAARARADIARLGTVYVRAHTVRHQADRTFAELLARYVPGCEELGAGKPINRDAMNAEEERTLESYAERLAVSAEALSRAGLGGAAGLDAYRALGLSPGNRRAGALLGYVLVDGAYVPKRHQAMRSRGLALTRFGWLPEPIARMERPGMAPDAGRWAQARAVDAAHSTWARRHVLSYDFIEIQTNAPHASIVKWAREVDATVGWMRALFLRTPGYQEPVWPLLIRIYRTPQEALANGDRSPRDLAYFRGHGVATAASFGPRTMKMRYAMTRAIASGFLEHAFPVNMSGGVYSGWMTDAFAKWATYASADRPNDSGFADNTDRATELVVAEVRKGQDVFSELRKMQYADAIASDLAAAAPLLAEFCFADEQRWEGFARFCGRFTGYREQYTDFDDLLAPAAEVSRTLKSWLDERVGPGVDPGQPPTAPGTGNVGHRVTINSRFLTALGIDVTGLTDSLGGPAAVKIAADAINAFVSTRTAAGKPAAGVTARLMKVGARHEWILDLNGPAAAVRSLLTDILWQAGLRLPPGAIPMPGGAPGAGGNTPPTRPEHHSPPRPHRPGDPVASTPPRGDTPAAPEEPGPQLIPKSTAAWAKQSLSGLSSVAEADLNRIGQGKPSAVTTLIRLLKTGSDPVRGAAAIILGRVGPVAPEIVPALSDALSDRVDENRRMVAQAFKRFGANAKEATPILVERLGADPYWVVRQQIAIALQKMPEAEIAGETMKLIAALEDKEKKVRDEVVKVLEPLSKQHADVRIALAIHAQREKADVKRLLDDILGGND